MLCCPGRVAVAGVTPGVNAQAPGQEKNLFFLHGRTGHTGEELQASQVSVGFVVEQRHWDGVFSSFHLVHTFLSLQGQPGCHVHFLMSGNPKLPVWACKQGHVYLQWEWSSHAAAQSTAPAALPALHIRTN